MTKDEYERLAKEIVDVSITVDRIMGPGLLESFYELCMMKEFELRRINARNQVVLPLVYKGFELSKEFKVDILVENEIVLELKSAETMIPVFVAQIISYLKLSEKKLGFLINYNVPVMNDGIKRFVNNY